MIDVFTTQRELLSILYLLEFDIDLRYLTHEFRVTLPTTTNIYDFGKLESLHSSTERELSRRLAMY